jgi:hypothetical protein
MKTKTIITNVAIALSLGIVYTGCKKDKDNEATPSTTTPTTTTTTTVTSTESANSVAESSFTDIFKSLSEISATGSGLRSSCATITIDSFPGASFPKTVTIDYGSSGCSGKTGKLTAVFTGKFGGALGTTIAITTDSNYTINSHKVRATTQLITNSGLTAGHKTFNLSVVGGNVGLPGGSVSWNSNRTITWVAGDSTLDPLDDVYEMSGTSSGTNMNGDVFTSTISTPLKVANNCPWIESGVITITTFNKKTRTIDFGAGACDNKATVTIDTITSNINL